MRLIDADTMIEDLEYDIELDARTLDDTDLLLGINRKLIQFDKDCKQKVVDILKNAPTVDAVPVIRCKDCKKFVDEEDQSYCIDMAGQCDSNGFCAWAERKEE